MCTAKKALIILFTITVASVLYLYWRTNLLGNDETHWDMALRTATLCPKSEGDCVSGIHEGCVEEYVILDKEWDIFRKTLTRYKHFHSAQLALLQSQASAPIRTLVWACEAVCSGLGARTRTLEASFLLAVLTNRVFGIHISDINKPSMQYLEPNEIDWSSVSETRQGLHKEADYVRQKGSKECDWSFFSLLESNIAHLTVKVGISKVLENCRSQLKYKFNKIGLKFGNDESVHEERGIVYHYLFQYSPQLLIRTQEAMQSLGLQDRRYLAIHMRTGFEGMDIQELPSGKFLQGQEYWKKGMDCVLEVADDEIGVNSPIFLSTDSYKAKEWAAAQYGDRVRTVTNVTIVHVDKRKSWTEEDALFLGTWIDIVLLARSYGLVRSGSGFSAFAGELCMIPSHRIYSAFSCKQKHLPI